MDKAIKMIAADLDRTLLHRDETLSAQTADVIARLRGEGFKIVIATSRSLASAEKYIDALSPNAVIFSGGAVAVIGGETVYDAMISPEKADEYIARCSASPFVSSIRVNGESADLTSNPEIAVGESEFGHYTRVDFVPGGYPRQKLLKITIRSDFPEEAAALFESDGDCVFTPSYAGGNCHKLSHAGANKSSALAAVAAEFGILPQEIAAFGDDTPDIGMLEMCGIGVAAANASEIVKAAADIVRGDCDDDGAAVWIKKTLLD